MAHMNIANLFKDMNIKKTQKQTLSFFDVIIILIRLMTKFFSFDIKRVFIKNII